MPILITNGGYIASSNKTMEDAWKKAGWKQCPKCKVYFHPLHTYNTDGKHCAHKRINHG